MEDAEIRYPRGSYYYRKEITAPVVTAQLQQLNNRTSSSITITWSLTCTLRLFFGHCSHTFSFFHVPTGAQPYIYTIRPKVCGQWPRIYALLIFMLQLTMALQTILWQQLRDSPFLLLHDNAPVHKTRYIKKQFSQFGAEELDWPAQSPDPYCLFTTITHGYNV